ncbi:PI-PLC X domain-containing protein At5g67130 [Beta vulgaris subsp. vulgaris]|uniref:PI-PLC X domain-containing protein At5g67130 n=1 Tax=Beta vulgaris subsp. vulgaris TaxID=3555 RepID=UPI0020368040|nr:PI-PLC X domain-containing protein At5g67130 [Beta vulgaris subsp. vulgaris]
MVFKKTEVSLSTLFIILAILFNFTSALQNLGETCISDRNCDQGLHCETCLANRNLRLRCTRIQPINPFSKVRGLPFNKYSWLTTHNSFARFGQKSATGSVIVAPSNQQDSVTSQLNNGVRGFMLDMYDFENDVWLCHSFGGQCYNYTAFKPAKEVLNEMQTFLEANPSEIITIFIEDYVTSPKGLTKLFDSAGLRKFWFPVSRMPKNGGNWPTVDDMIQKNQRLLVFTSKAHKEAAEGIAYNWRYVLENQYGDGGMQAGSCPNRAESRPMNTSTISLVLVNYFPTAPNLASACKHNSAPLESMLSTCYNESGKRWANYVTVDFYKRSDGGGVSAAVDEMNGHLVCGCASITECRANMTFGSCNIPQAGPDPPMIAPIASVGYSKQLLRIWWIFGIISLACLMAL